MIAAQNVENLMNRLASEETEASLAVYDMLQTGAIYQNQNDFEYYTTNKETGQAYKLDRFKSVFLKQVGLSFKFMNSTKYRKVQDG